MFDNLFKVYNIMYKLYNKYFFYKFKTSSKNILFMYVYFISCSRNILYAN